MTTERKWIHSATLTIDHETGAILVSDISGGGGGGGGGGQGDDVLVDVHDTARHALRTVDVAFDASAGALKAKVLSSPDGDILTNVHHTSWQALRVVDRAYEDSTGALKVRPVSGGHPATPSSFPGGTQTAIANTPTPLVNTPTPCQFVWVGARVDADGQPLNTKVVYVGDNNTQTMPLLPDSYEGIVIRIDDVSKVYIRTAVSGEGVAYRYLA